MSKRRLSTKNMVWTLNAPKGLGEAAQLSWITAEASQIDKRFKDSDAVFLAYQMERVENSHLQGILQWTKRTGMRAARKVLGKSAAIMPMNGTPKQALAYCQKEESRIDGTAPIQNGEFQDHVAKSKAAGREAGGSHWALIREAIKAGATKEELRNDDRFVGHIYRYEKAIDNHIRDVKLAARRPEDIPENPDWRAFQKQILAWDGHLRRKLLWIVDPKGNQGKTFVGKHQALYKGALLMDMGKLGDMRHIYSKHLSQLVYIDIPRTSALRVQYGFIENLMDGKMTSGKYDGDAFLFKKPRVVVTSNDLPELMRDGLPTMSPDRWEIWHLKDGQITDVTEKHLRPVRQWIKTRDLEAETGELQTPGFCGLSGAFDPSLPALRNDAPYGGAFGRGNC